MTANLQNACHASAKWLAKVLQLTELVFNYCRLEYAYIAKPRLRCVVGGSERVTPTI
jgi:hypothetical protein